jgi:hypothetical protein
MDDATLAVVGSITAALLGSLTGAGINEHAARRRDNRREMREAEAHQARLRAAARLVFIELQLARNQVEDALAAKRFVFGIRPPGTAWATHGVLLADALSEGDYDALAEACGKEASARGWSGLSVFVHTSRLTGDLRDARNHARLSHKAVCEAARHARGMAHQRS